MAAISGKSRVFCVLGDPIGHSVSPAMQNAALRALGIDGVYVAFQVRCEDLPRAVDGLQALGVAGVNCTIPHKEALVPLMDELSADAALIGAVNTIEFRDGRRIGHNTDAPGFLEAVRAAGVEPGSGPSVVLGAGGSARAVVAALVRAGARVTIANRTAERAEGLAREINDRIGRSVAEAVPLEERAVEAALKEAHLLVNTTSAGMSPRTNEMPAVPVDALGSHLFVYDLIYNPIETRLLREARARGARGMHGAGMLARQGALALKIWTGKEAPAELMERVILEMLSEPAKSGGAGTN